MIESSQTPQERKRQSMVGSPIKRYLIAMGLFTTIIISLVMVIRGVPTCQHLINQTKPLSQTIDPSLEMNRTRANVVMEYKIPIVFIWLGKQLPPRYKQRLQWITFPYILIGEKEWEELGIQFHAYNLMPVQKADILRLLYLQKHAGIYSDLDNILDYRCIMRMVARKRGFWMAGEPFVTWQPQASNLFLYVDRPNHPLIITALTAIKQKISHLEPYEIQNIFSVYFVTGPYMLGQLGVQKFNEIYNCQDHQVDSIWAK